MINEPMEHLTEALMQDYADGALPETERAAADVHLSACARCRTELQAWQLLFSELAELPRFAPDPGFAERVMAQVRRPAQVPAGARLQARLQAWVRSLFPLPATGRTWALAAGAVTAPAVAVGGLAWWIFSYPQVTPGTLTTYLLWRARSTLGALLSGLYTRVLESELALRLYTVVEHLVQAPGAALVAAGTFSAVTALALWVLYRNLFATRTVDGRHALLLSF